MNPSRTLMLKRESLQQLTSGELDSVVGAAQTRYSCLDGISCWWWQCVPTLYVCTER